MATLVLSAVGTAVGGPVGGLIGAALGGAVDRQWLGPRPRQGPRLADLRLQTSTYGSAIARLYGRTRVAGTVIWATDLEETKATSGGKGQPETTTYSYAASLAVALSSRPIVAVERIWADGRLLRGAAGDFKTATGFRLATGDPDQPVDPLIASAVGAGQCPAHRGIAYAVFEDMALAAYGNRIPSLTFEVVADAGAIDVGAVARDLLPAPFGAASAIALTGYAAEGARIGDAIAPLAALGDLHRGGAPLAPMLVSPGGGAPRTITPAAPARIERAAGDAVPPAVTVRHYDPARDYQSGAQTATRGGSAAPHRARQVDLPATLDAADALAAARRIVRAELAAADHATIRAGPAALRVRPGDAVTVDGIGGRWWVSASEIDAQSVALTLARIPAADALAAPGAAAPGLPVREDDWPVPPTFWRFVELPDIVGNAPNGAVRIAAAGTGPGWRGGDVTLSGGAWDGEPVARIVRESAMGIAASALAPADPALFDRLSSVEVDLLHADMALSGAADDAMIAGRNLALLGGELIQFGRAEPLSPTRWRLSQLLRGRGATEGRIAAHAAGESFTLIDLAALATIAPALVAGGGAASVAGVGDPDPPALPLPDGPAGDPPPAPVHPRIARHADGSVTISWTRRSRAGFGWHDGVDAPLGEDRELYRIAIGDGETAIGETAVAEVTVAAATLAPYAPGAATVRIRQVGTYAPSDPLVVTIEP